MNTLLAIFMGVVMMVCNVMFDGVQDAILNADSITISHMGQVYYLEKNDTGYDIVYRFLAKILEESYQVPALGVALHDEVEGEKSNKDWIEFNFEKQCCCDGMIFESLLIFLEKDMGGFNVFRKVNGKYDGRCYYINLQDNSNNFL